YDRERRVLDAAADGLRAAVSVRRLLDLFPGAVPDAAARPRRGVLLQHGPVSGRAGAEPVRIPRDGHVVPVGRYVDVIDLRGRNGRIDLGAGDEGESAAGGLGGA